MPKPGPSEKKTCDAASVQTCHITIIEIKFITTDFIREETAARFIKSNFFKELIKIGKRLLLLTLKYSNIYC